MDKNKKDKMSVQERAALLMSLMRPPDKFPTPNAQEARKILKSLQIYQPVKVPSGSLLIRNRVTNLQGSMVPTSQGNSVQFTSNDSYDRPAKPNTRIQQLGKNATVNQLINELPTIRDKSKGIDNRATFNPIKDDRDFEREARTGKPSNSRNSLYRRNTNGAFNAHPRKGMDGDYKGHVTRKGDTTWQPRAAGGKFGKHVQFNPTDVVRELGKVAIERGAIRFIPQVGPALQQIMTVDSTIEGFTGKSPIKEFMSIAKDSIEDQSIPRPATLMMY
jgi:hypothetical protein